MVLPTPPVPAVPVPVAVPHVPHSVPPPQGILAGVDVAVGPGVGAGAVEQVVEDLAAISMG